MQRSHPNSANSLIIGLYFSLYYIKETISNVIIKYRHVISCFRKISPHYDYMISHYLFLRSMIFASKPMLEHDRHY